MSKYAFETMPTLVFAIKWDGDNWAEMQKFLKDYTPGWELSVYTTDDRTVLVERHARGTDIVLEPGEWLIVFPEDNEATVGRDSTMAMSYRKKIIL